MTVVKGSLSQSHKILLTFGHRGHVAAPAALCGSNRFAFCVVSGAPPPLPGPPPDVFVAQRLYIRVPQPDVLCGYRVFFEAGQAHGSVGRGLVHDAPKSI